MAFLLWIILPGIVIWFLLKYLNSTDIPKIKGLPEPFGWPIFGNLFQLGENHALALLTLSEKFGSVFQIRLGNRRIVVANSYDSIREIWIKNQSSLISRPMLYTFHNVVSSSQGFTIGTSPWDESCKRRRQAAAAALNKTSIQSYLPIVDNESFYVIKDILNECKDGQRDININDYLQRFASNTTLMVNYGRRFSSSSDKLFREVVEVQAAIARFRSTSRNWQDYVPLLRIFPARSNEANSYRIRRDRYLKTFLDGLKNDIANGIDRPCILGNILKDPSTKLNETEIKSICLTMVGASLDTIPGSLAFGIGYLSSPHGQLIQERAFQEIQDVYPDNDAWNKCLVEERVPYVSALCKEILRFFPAHLLSLPRQSISDINYNGVVIPGGTTCCMNVFAGNYDPNHFKDPYTFDPERYLDDVGSTPHFSYGAGSRMCIGVHLGNRQFYIFFLRLISAFRILEAHDSEHAPVLDAMKANISPSSLAATPKPFKCRFEPRNKNLLECWLDTSEKQIIKQTHFLGD